MAKRKFRATTKIFMRRHKLRENDKMKWVIDAQDENQGFEVFWPAMALRQDLAGFFRSLRRPNGSVFSVLLDGERYEIRMRKI